jgi:hypothetical protein
MNQKQNNGVKAQLEQMCTAVDTVLSRHGHSAKVAGGYVAGNGLLFSLSDTTFVNTGVRHDLRQALQAKAVLATVGVVLVNGWLRERGETADIPETDIIEGEYEEIRPTARPSVATADIMELIAEYQQWGGAGRPGTGQTGAADAPTARLNP